MLRDMQDALLEAQADVEEAWRDVVKELFEEAMASQVVLMWVQMTPEAREEFKRTRPQEYAALMKGMKNNGRK